MHVDGVCGGVCNGVYVTACATACATACVAVSVPTARGLAWDHLRRRQEEHTAELVVRVSESHHACLKEGLHLMRVLVEHRVDPHVGLDDGVVREERALAHLVR